MKKVIGIICMICLIIIDQIIKAVVVANYDVGEGFSIINNVLCIEYVQNTGAAWGMMSGATVFFAIFALIVSVGLIYFLLKIPNDKKYNYMFIAIIFLISGAIGNLIDRIDREFVVDYIYFKLIDFPVFNLADIYITLSGIALLILILFYYKDDNFEFIFKKEKSKNEIK